MLKNEEIKQLQIEIPFHYPSIHLVPLKQKLANFYTALL